jgi:hypothetical protein
MVDSVIYPDGREAFFENADLVGNSERVEPHENEFSDIAAEQYLDLTQDEILDVGNIEFYDEGPMDVYDEDAYVDAGALSESLVEVSAESIDYSDPVAIEDYEDYGEY